MKLSVIIPCHNEEENIKNMFDTCCEELGSIDYELIFINDGSIDQTADAIKTIYKQNNNRVKGINFSRNFGKEAAIYAGIKLAKGEYTAIIDGDLQQHPKYLVSMLEYLDKNEDTDQVAMFMRTRKEKGIKSFLANGFYSIITSLSDVKFRSNASDFRMFRTNVKNAILELSEVNRFSKGIFAWIGFNTHYMPYEVQKREHGKSSFNFGSLLKYAIDGIVGFSVKPLSFATYAGMLTSASAFIYFLIVVIKTLIFGKDVPGYASLLCVSLLLGGIQLLSIGILGKYISKTYLETKKRPIYITKSKIGFEDDELL